MKRLYQDTVFKVAELQGQQIQKFVVCNDADYPGSDSVVFISITVKNKCFRCSLDKGISFVDMYDKLTDDNRLLYEDITQKHQLKNKKIKRVYSKDDQANSRIIFEVDTLKFVLKCVDPNHFDDENNEFKQLK